MRREQQAAELSREELLELVYELLDAHDDTAQLAAWLTDDLRWKTHLDYLRDLQRVGRETLARAAPDDETTEVGVFQVERQLRMAFTAPSRRAPRRR